MHREKLASICVHARAAHPVIHSWRRPREQRFRPGSRLSNWKNEANARYRHGGQVSLTLSNRMTKLENEIRMLVLNGLREGGAEPQHLPFDAGSSLDSCDTSRRAF